MKPLMSEEAGDVATICMSTSQSSCSYKYRSLIRSFITKLPGTQFSGFKEVVMFNPIAVVSEPQYAEMMDDLREWYMNNTDDAIDNWQFFLNNTEDYGWSNGVPKSKLYIKLSADCDATRREFIINGLRPYLDDSLSVVFDTQAFSESLDSANAIFSVLVGVIGIIALVLTFFLLLVATTQNIRDNIWEYGVLRSMGVTKAEGSRIFMYEAFLVIVAATIIGVAIGTVVACLITAQFYMFLELPFSLQFPWILVALLLFVSMSTTYFAVAYPMRGVNKR